MGVEAEGRRFKSCANKVKEVEAQWLVAYKLQCNSCEASYIGKVERIKEYKTSNSSACFQHMKNNVRHKIDYDGIEIIDRADNNMKLQVKELLHILNQKPTLNKSF
ncbi:unnamed protein product [Brachionus calyciflorus]|uniref:Uncharacterized protein n=1 Tax=Brachionus calyciflorus TaxID=104777 RepID=A0A814M7W0_9BILA|nr:unnamed protein product [Brachionus calyciflorus]